MSLPIRKDDPRFGDKLIEDYLDLFNSYSIKNELYGRISLHAILGQAICKRVYYQMGARRIDTRVHLLLIKPQGTGKGAGYGLVLKMAKAVGLNFQSLTESTDAGLVGTLDRDENGNRIILDGLLKTADMIGMEEASVLFDYTNEFSKKNMTYMQITMNALEDSSCFISKKLGPELIEFKPHASFILLTYPPDRLVDKLLKTGFMDRIICIFEEVTLEDRLSVIEIMSRRTSVSDDDYKKKFKDVESRLKAVIRYFTETNISTRIVIPDKVHDVMIQVIQEFAMKILDASPKAREKLEHFISRLYEVLMKLAIHHAVLNIRRELDVSDVMYARMTYFPIWRNLIISIESLLIISDIERHRKFRIQRSSLDEYDRVLKEGKYPHLIKKVWVRRLSMIGNLQTKWDQCSKETADNNLRKLEKLPESDTIYTQFSRKDVEKLEKDKFFERKNVGGIDYIRKIRDIK